MLVLHYSIRFHHKKCLKFVCLLILEVPLKYWMDDLIVYGYKLVRCLVYEKVGKYYLFIKSKRMSIKSTVFKLILIVMFNPQSLKILIILFLIRSTSGPDKFRKMPKS